MDGVFLDLDTVNPDDLDLSKLKSALPGLRIYGATFSRDLPARLHDVSIVITNKVRLDADAIRSAPALRYICLAATGTNNVDLDAAGERGIVVSNVQAYATVSVVQHVFALLLALSTHLPDYLSAVRNGRWEKATQFCLLDYSIEEIAGKTIGIIGYGELGRAVARMARAFDMYVEIAQRRNTAPQPGRVPLEELLSRVDVVSIHTPLTPENRGLIGASELALMKRDALLINTARGGIVDEAALAGALREGRIGGAGVDVLSEEPPVHGSPLLAQDVPNLILTPHTAWASRQSRQRLIDEIADNIHAFRQGTPRNRVA